MFGDIFDNEVERGFRDFIFGRYEVRVSCVSGENQHIDKWVPLVVWRAAEAFANELALNPERELTLEGKRIVELGSGTGLCGILAAKISKTNCLLTDGNYMYFGKARELPEVKNYFKQLQAEVATEKSSLSSLQPIPSSLLTYEYYGFDDDEELSILERDAEDLARENAVKAFKCPALIELNKEPIHWDETWKIPTKEEIDAALLEYRKIELLRKYAS